MKKTDVAIIGAGPAGITCAQRLAEGGANVQVFEASASVGGLCGSFRLWDHLVDYGPHRFFSSDPRVNGLWLSFTGEDREMVDRQTRIFHDGRFFHYPLKAMNAFKTLGPFESLRCVVSCLNRVVWPLPDDGTFRNWVANRFGDRLFSLFFESYTEKLWGIPCDQLDADFAAQRIKNFSLLEAVKTALTGSTGGHKTLVDQFAYPKAGAVAPYRAMAEDVERRGGRIRLNAPIERVLTENGRAVGLRLESGETVRADHVVSSMDLTRLVAGLDCLTPAAREMAQTLTYRNTVLAYLLVEGERLFPDNWLYVHSRDLACGRVTNFRNWVSTLPADDGKSVLCLEYWANDDDPDWRADDGYLADRAAREIVASGLAPAGSVKASRVVRVKASYPVYDRGYKTRLKPVERALDEVAGLTVIGRGGAFKYNNQDHSMLMGMLAADNVLGAARHDLWAVNTDDDYQEAARVEDAFTPGSAQVQTATA